MMNLLDIYGNYFYGQQIILLALYLIVALGLILYGKKIELVSIVILSFIGGFYFSSNFLYNWVSESIQSTEISATVFGIVCGIVTVVLAFVIRKTIILLLGALLGFIIAYLLISFGVISHFWAFWVLFIAIGMLVSMIIYDFFIKLITSFLGSIVLILSIVALLTEILNYSFGFIFNYRISLLFIIFIITFIGIIKQK